FSLALSSPCRQLGRTLLRVSSSLKMSAAGVSDDINCENPKELYEKAEEYWANAPRDDDGMLGGFAHLHKPDITQSRNFLSGLHKKGFLSSNEYAIDCGAGIGRVTKHLLLPAFKKVDMVELVKKLVEKSDSYIGPNPSMGEKFVSGLQDFVPEKGKYDLIWIQWVSGHLTNRDFTDFFIRCKDGLRENGLICLKENLSDSGKPLFDDEDHSWTRPESLVIELFNEAGLTVVASEQQRLFPKGMYPVKMFAMKPTTSVTKAQAKTNMPTLI
ncbi:homt-1, partial [Pristionchus pacificus]